MTAPSQKLLRDFWRERVRALLVVLAIALGISGFAAVLSAYAILTRELDKGYLATNPASAILRTDAIDDELLAAILANREVSDAEPRRVVNGQLKAGPAEWRNLTLFVVKDYGDIRVSRLDPQEGAWPPSTGEVLIERDALQVARARIGDTVTVKTSRGKEAALLVSGSAHDVGQAQARMENIVYGYITLATLVQLGEEPYLDRLNLLVARNRLDEAHILKVAGDVRDLIESRGKTVRRLDVPGPGKHPHSDIMGVLLLSMSTFGLFVLILSGILVANLMTGLMASQVRQIGMMKTIGASRWQIARIYFGQALLLGIAATLLALPAGIIGSRLLCRYMAVFLNFDITSFATPAWVYLLVAFAGLLAPVLAAAYPVLKGTSVSVREALADYGVHQSTFGTGVLDRVLAGVGGITRPLLLALRNSFRKRARLALTLITLAAGGLFFLSALNVRASLVNTLDRLFAARKFDLTVSLAGPYPRERAERAIMNTAGVVKGECWFTTEGMLDADERPPDATGDEAGTEGKAGRRHSGGDRGDLHPASGRDRFNVVALPVETELLAPDIIEGRSLAAGDTDAMVVNSGLAARRPDIKVGATIAVRMGPAVTNWRIVGLAKEPFSSATGYIPAGFVEERHGAVTNSLRIALDRTDSASLGLVKGDLDRNLESEQIRAVGSSSKADSRYGFDQHMVMIYVFLIIVSCIVGGVGGLGLMTTMSLNVMERRREMGVLRAIGASPRVVWLIVVSEGVVVGLLSWLLASLIAWPLSKVIGDLMVRLILRGGVDFRFEPLGLLIWLAASVVLGAFGSFVPAWQASRYEVREALEYE
jgi:putative ABC transport system permease protein